MEMDDSLKWDLFISYRALESMFVRNVVDQLFSAGCRPWFAEYETFDWQKRQHRTWVDAQVFAGIKGSRWGAVFVSLNYMDSKNCTQELEQMLKTQGVFKLLQISLDGTRLEQLRPCATIECGLQDVMEAVDLILSHIGADGLNMGRPGKKLRLFRKHITFGRQFCLDANGWRRWWLGALRARLDDLEARQRGLKHGDVHWGPFLQRDILLRDGTTSKLLMNLRFGPENHAIPDAWTIDMNTVADPQQERAVFDKLNAYAAKIHLDNVRSHAGVEVALRGTHLLLSQQAFGHIAITYKVTTGGVTLWFRKASIHRRGRGTDGSWYEFVFTFTLTGTFEDYCRHTGLMDDLALSVDYL
jgi:hypothetical protein